MKFSTGLSPGTFGRSAALSAMLLVSFLIACVTSYGNTASTTLRTEPISRTSYSKRCSQLGKTAGADRAREQQFATLPDRLTNSIDLKIYRLSAEKSRRSPSSSAVPIANRSSSLKISTTFTSQSLRTIRANRYGSFLPTDISPTVLLYSDVRRQRNLPISAAWRESGSRISPIDKQRPSFRQPFSVSGIGHISAVLRRQRSISPGSWQPSTRGRPRSVASSTENLSASASPRLRSRRLNQLEPGDFALELYESAIGKAISKDPVNTIKAFLEPDGKTISDQLVEMGRGFPPYHPNCRTRLEGVIEGVSDEESQP
jgi:hypothetical protein